MTSKVNPAISIELEGRERHLLFSFNAMVAFEEATGKNLFEKKVIDKIIGHISPSELRALVWAMLLHEDKSITLEDVGAWITIENKEECAGKVLQAWLAAMPDKGDKKEKVPLAINHPNG